MSNVAFHTIPGALAQTVTEEMLYCSVRHLHSCQLHGLLLSYTKAIRKLGTVNYSEHMSTTPIGRFVSLFILGKVNLSLCLIIMHRYMKTYMGVEVKMNHY